MTVPVGKYVRVTSGGQDFSGQVAWSKNGAFRLVRQGRIFRVDRGDVVVWTGDTPEPVPGLLKRIGARLKFWG